MIGQIILYYKILAKLGEGGNLSRRPDVENGENSL